MTGQSMRGKDEERDWLLKILENVTIGMTAIELSRSARGEKAQDEVDRLEKSRKSALEWVKPAERIIIRACDDAGRLFSLI
jgi:hypothetical protein